MKVPFESKAQLSVSPS